MAYDGLTAGRHAGLVESLKETGRTALELVHTRLQLVATELLEEQARIVELALVAALSLLALFLAVVFGAFLVVVAFWDTPYRILATGLIAGALVLLALVLWLVFLHKAKAKGRAFAATLHELRTDIEHLR